MTSADYVEQASYWSRELTRMYGSGPGEMERAWIKISQKYGIPYGTLWALRYRLPKTIDVGMFVRIWAAWRDSQRDRLAEGLANFTPVTGADHDLVLACKAVVGKAPTAEADAKNLSEGGE